MILRDALISAGLTIVTMTIQIVTVGLLIWWLRKREAALTHRGLSDLQRYLSRVHRLSVATLCLLIGHFVQIAIWAQAFCWLGEFSDFGTAYYHSTVNFSTLGVGDIVMSQENRLIGAIEAIVGVLMCGLSSATLFAIVMHMLPVQKRG